MVRDHRMRAYFGLLRHYFEVTRYHWTHRDRISEEHRRRDEAEFLPAALALRDSPVSPASRVTALVLCGLGLTVVLWASLGRLDITVTATGKVIPTARSKTVASVDTASVKAVHVQEGQAVRRGDLLLELDSSAPNADAQKAIAAERAARLQVARSKALIQAVDRLQLPRLPAIEGVSTAELRAEQDHLQGQFYEFISKLRVIESDIKRYEEGLPLAIQRESDYKTLADTHDVSIHSLFDKVQARIDLQGQLGSARNQRASLIDTTKKDALDVIAEGERNAQTAAQDATKATAHASLLDLTAPVDGSVQQLTVHTVGGVVAAAQPLMMIVPSASPLEVEAFLEDKDIGFVREGQEAQVKIEPYEYTKYGTISGKVAHVSRDAIDDEKKGLLYSVKIVLDRTSIPVNGAQEPVSAGMSATVDIKTGTRRAIDYVLEPLLQHRAESLHER